MTTMTDGRRPIPVAAIAGGLFCVVLIYLALQVGAGNDPAIGAGEQAAPAPRPVIVRRVVIQRIVEEDASSTGGSSSGSVVAANAPAAADPVPAAAAPAPAAPAPRPAVPAPVVSRGS
jgi:pyruvate dehydrogenase E2 component (dihydrolipoamide acetyltransferase)